ncbi:hypothetical protein EXIGLDRAFT_844677 [Exidia glandulosa HHB12029]|uniref:F-box domain-containing protein n=1 Tax=Exidia glandulosa HHB12029 TaxID=1314781 RepID=A0A165BWC9_EXIGL|nr:hypothetical protein EXIGLDRAFT_844677 [Exidia glandulosa HHB12029]
MPGFSDLPVELVILVIERVAWDYCSSNKAWVASLCRISRAIQHIITPVLYHTVEVTWRNFETLLEIAARPDSPLHATRCVYIPLVFVPCVQDIDTFVSALQHVQEFAFGLFAFEYWVPHLSPAQRSQLCAVSLHERIQPVSMLCTPPAVKAVIHCIPYLRIVVELSAWDAERLDMLSFHTRYLIMDVEDRGSANLAECLSRKLTTLLRIPTLERLLVRPRIRNHRYRGPGPDFADVLGRWASESREPRLWVEDMPAITSTDVAAWNMQLGCNPAYHEDVYRGRDAWMRGRQLYCQEDVTERRGA